MVYIIRKPRKRVMSILCNMGGEMANEWENIALYLADCQAATTEHLALLKSSKKSELRRHASICQSMLRAIENGYMSERARDKETILQRMRDAIRDAMGKIG